MMQMIVILLVLSVFLNDTLELPQTNTNQHAPTLLTLWLASLLLCGCIYWLQSKITFRSLGNGNENRSLKRLERSTLAYRWLITTITFIAMLSGILDLIRSWFDSIFFIPDMLFLAPAFGLFIWGWFCHYPIDRRLRESSIIRAFDDEKPFANLPSRGSFILNHIRHELLIVLVPLTVILLWAQTVENLIIPKLYTGENGRSLDIMSLESNGLLDTGSLLIMAGAAIVFILSPLMIRWVWDTAPLSEGTVRARLTRLCQTNHVGVSDMLLWRTTGTMINAAVIGISSKMRYILLSDALLDTVPSRQLEAVMAHEIAHIRKKHIFWLVLSAIAILASLELIFNLIFESISKLLSIIMLNTIPASNGEWIQYIPGNLQEHDVIFLLTVISTLIGWVILFGRISRIAERQADTFAAKHMTHAIAAEEADTEPEISTISPQGAMMMISALQLVADLNHIPTTKHNWRHGSIQYRQDYLRSLVGQNMNSISVDRQMKWVNYACFGLIVATIALQSLISAS